MALQLLPNPVTGNLDLVKTGGSGAVWGGITGTLSDQTDLQTALDAKASTASLSDYAKLDSTNQPFTDSITNNSLNTETRQLFDSSGVENLNYSQQGLAVAGRIIIGGGSDDTVNDLQLNGSNSIIFGGALTQGYYFGVPSWSNFAFSPSDVRTNFWERISAGGIQNNDVLTYDSASQTWYAAAPAGGGGGGVTTMGAFGSSPNGDGATISGVTLTLQPADATNPGGVSTTTQSFLGTKTFLNAINYLNSSATANTVFDGLILNNSTTASSGNQQYSPRQRFIGQGWKTNSVAASQSVEFSKHVVPVQGAANPTGSWLFQYSVNGAAYTTAMQINTSSQVLFADGTSSLPSIALGSNTATGFYKLAANFVGATANGTNTWGWDANALYIGTMGTNNTQFSVHPSSTSKHGAIWRSRNSVAVDYWNFQNDSATQEASLFRSSGAAGKWSLRLNSDSSSAPAYSYYSDNNTGHYSKAADDLGLSTGGTLRVNWTTTEQNFSEGYNIKVGTTTGTKIATATTEKIGFYGATPIVQGASVADATGGATIDSEARTAINAVISRLEALGLIATV